jgi:hypothetical protein
VSRAGRHAEAAQTRERVLAAAAELIGAQGSAVQSSEPKARACC